MDKSQFWQLIAQSQTESGDCEQQAAKLSKLLLQLEAQEILEFDFLFADFSNLAYRWDLWGAAYLINGGASDDGFEYFRWWLIARGKQYFEAALENPERAGDKAEFETAECEDIAYCINDAFREKSGKDLPIREKGANYVASPRGESWEEADLEILFPALFEKFG